MNNIILSYVTNPLVYSWDVATQILHYERKHTLQTKSIYPFVVFWKKKLPMFISFCSDDSSITWLMNCFVILKQTTTQQFICGLWHGIKTCRHDIILSQTLAILYHWKLREKGWNNHLWHSVHKFWIDELPGFWWDWKIFQYHLVDVGITLCF